MNNSIDGDMNDPGSGGPEDPVITATRAWVDRAVVGLNLCPFARPVHQAGRIRYVATHVRQASALADVLADELEKLASADSTDIETTLIVHPDILQDFLDYNDFLDVADALVEEMELDGVLQVASFHPQYQFEGTSPDDIGNFSNRSPYPTLHLLREESVERAVATHPDVDSIPLRNIATLEKLGIEGWQRLDVDAPEKPDVEAPGTPDFDVPENPTPMRPE